LAPSLRGSLLVLLLYWLALPASAATGVDEVRDCLEANLPERSSQQSVTFVAYDRTGSSTVSKAEILWRKFDEGSRAVLRFSEPADLRGSALLLIEKDDSADMFMYLPELRKVRRVNKRSVSGSVLGTDFSYEDFERLQGMASDTELERREDDDLDGRPVFVVEARPARGDDSEYEKVVSYVDRETCVPLRTEMYEKQERLSKVLVTSRDRIEHHASSWVPRWVRMDDLVDGTYTELTIDSIELEKEIPEAAFSERALQRAGR
jgi:outer membrane lipoprotein-sorting protein